jgi:hypothetical protein
MPPSNPAGPELAKRHCLGDNVHHHQESGNKRANKFHFLNWIEKELYYPLIQRFILSAAEDSPVGQTHTDAPNHMYIQIYY